MFFLVKPSFLNAMTPAIRIGIVEDQTPLLKRLLDHLRYYPDVDVCLTAQSGKAFLERLEGCHPERMPEIVLMDIELPGISGIETTYIVKERHPDLDVLMFTIFEDDERIFDAIQAGASGYLLKDEPIDTVVASIRDMHAGGAPMSASIAKKVLAMMRQAAPAKPRDPAESDLTDREAQILKELATGKTTAAIGDVFFLSPLTVKTHIKNIYKKLHVSSRAEATRVALKRNLV
jgi:DNA-binding NarL/FixJ family response regulator